MSFSQHMTMNPRIEVNGDTAKGTWYFFGPFTFRENNQAKWQATRYHEDGDYTFTTYDGWLVVSKTTTNDLSLAYARAISNMLPGDSGFHTVMLVLTMIGSGSGSSGFVGSLLSQ